MCVTGVMVIQSSPCYRVSFQILTNVFLYANDAAPQAGLYDATRHTPLQLEGRLNEYSIVYSGLNQFSTTIMNKAFTTFSESHGQVTRSSMQDNLSILHCKLEGSNGNLKVWGATYYNNIPCSTQALSTLRRLKQNLKKSIRPKTSGRSSQDFRTSIHTIRNEWINKWYIYQSIKQSINQLIFSQLNSCLINQLLRQSVNQSISQSIDQSINQSWIDVSLRKFNGYLPQPHVVSGSRISLGSS